MVKGLWWVSSRSLRSSRTISANGECPVSGFPGTDARADAAEGTEGERATKVALVIALTGAARAARSFWWGFYLEA
ncbi:MAG TPA: hypothetical protein DIU09_10255, partial [Hyphomonadaceae bacterium]|nr:hypothetical protein [Hyphomonadaceae bacterium]